MGQCSPEAWDHDSKHELLLIDSKGGTCWGHVLRRCHLASDTRIMPQQLSIM